MTTAQIVRAYISARALAFNPTARRASRRRTPEQEREAEIFESWRRHLRARVTPYRDLPKLHRP